MGKKRACFTCKRCKEDFYPDTFTQVYCHKCLRNGSSKHLPREEINDRSFYHYPKYHYGEAV